MVRLSTRQQQRTPRWTLPRPFYRDLKTALQSAVVGMAYAPELRRVICQLLDDPDARGASRDDLMASLRVGLVDAAIELGLPPGGERNDLLARMVSVCHDEVYRKEKREEFRRRAHSVGSN